MGAFRVVSASEGTNYSGSIAKVFALEAATITSCEFGLYQSPEPGTAFVPTSTWSTSTPLPVGSTLDGPIGRLKTGTGGVLIYFHHVNVTTGSFTGTGY